MKSRFTPYAKTKLAMVIIVGALTLATGAATNSQATKSKESVSWIKIYPTIPHAQQRFQMVEALQRMKLQASDLQKENLTVVTCLTGNGEAELLTHYPKSDVYDFETGYQYYYHSHPRQESPDEVGHFHTFWMEKDEMEQHYVHLVGISMNAKGEPIALFVTAQAITGERVVNKLAAIEKAKEFYMSGDAPTTRWLTDLFIAYRPQIEALINSKSRYRNGETLYIEISLKSQDQWLNQ